MLARMDEYLAEAATDTLYAKCISEGVCDLLTPILFC